MGDQEKREIPYVLALTILDSSTLSNGELVEDSRVRVCVRNRDVNRTHPDVVSVPTQRMPIALAREILATSKEAGIQDNTVLRCQEFVSSKRSDGHDPVIYCVESLLSRKLGVASELEKDEVAFEAAIAATHEGIAKYNNLNSEEYLRMINIRVHITKGADLFPQTTTSFDFSNWTSVKDFKRMWEDGKDVTLVGIDFTDAIGVCVEGLCILSTYDILKAVIATDQIKSMNAVEQ